MTTRMMTRRTASWTAYTVVRSGHVFVNGVHWLHCCELCKRLVAEADRVARESERHDASEVSQ